MWELPFGPGKRFFGNFAEAVVLPLWRLAAENTIAHWMCGLPFTPVSFATAL
jgi:hypothetical protein